MQALSLRRRCPGSRVPGSQPRSVDGLLSNYWQSEVDRRTARQYRHSEEDPMTGHLEAQPQFGSAFVLRMWLRLRVEISIVFLLTADAERIELQWVLPEIPAASDLLSSFHS